MMQLDEASIKTIVTHMNEDHADSVLGYAQRLGGIPNAESATLVTLDALCMTVEAMVVGSPTRITIPFDHPVTNVQEARVTLIALTKR